jgi:2-polyprenyl-6-methoxyphenol hydroxylase-like FAD-dependent oxidoreductase
LFDVNGSWDLLYHVLRANFDGVSSSYAQSPKDDDGETTYEYGCAVTGLNQDEDSDEMIVTYQDRDKREQKARTHRVFAADGPSSHIRQSLLPDVKRKYAGYVCH